jgi:SAM-dependent methyltransferase
VKCRLCNGELFKDPVLTLEGMPKAAQYFPDPAEFSKDQGVQLTIVECRWCGLVQLNSDPVPYHREVITAATLSGALREARKAKMCRLRREFDLVGKTVLEVGSGKGEMLDVLTEVGMNPIGIEFSEKAVSWGRECGRDIIRGYIGDEGVLGDRIFDAFICLNYLEHAPDPGKILRVLWKNISPNGVGYLTVPNLDYLLGSACLYEFVADHLSYFTKATISNALESNGFEVLECDLINNENDIAILCKKKERVSIGDARDSVDGLCRELKTCVEKEKSLGRTVAVWGAGHRTLALLALSRVECIDYIVDSAPFKQGLYAPVTHIPIAAPARLQESPVDLLLIMLPGIYSSEVVSIVKKMGLTTEIMTLDNNRLVSLP